MLWSLLSRSLQIRTCMCVRIRLWLFLGVIWLEKGVCLGKGRQLFAGLLDHIDWVDFFWLARYHHLPSLRHECKGWASGSHNFLVLYLIFLMCKEELAANTLSWKGPQRGVCIFLNCCFSDWMCLVGVEVRDAQDCEGLCLWCWHNTDVMEEEEGWSLLGHHGMCWSTGLCTC